MTFMGWGNFVVQKIMRQAAVEFGQRHPNIHAQYINSAGGSSYYTKLDTMLAGGDAPSVFYMDPSSMPSYAHKGAAAPVDSFVAADKVNLADFFPKALQQYYWQGKLYGLPRGFGNQDIYWNDGLFKAKGLEQPGLKWGDPNWTTDQFLTLAEKLTVRQGNRTVQFGYGQALTLRQWEPWVWIFGGEVVDAANRKCLLDQAPAVNGLQFLADLMNRY